MPRAGCGIGRMRVLAESRVWQREDEGFKLRAGGGRGRMRVLAEGRVWPRKDEGPS